MDRSVSTHRTYQRPANLHKVCLAIVSIFCGVRVRKIWGRYPLRRHARDEMTGDAFGDLIDNVLVAHLDFRLGPDFVQLFEPRVVGLRIPRDPSAISAFHSVFLNLIYTRFPSQVFLGADTFGANPPIWKAFRGSDILQNVFPRRALVFALLNDAFLVAQFNSKIVPFVVNTLRILDRICAKRLEFSDFLGHASRWLRCAAADAIAAQAVPMPTHLDWGGEETVQQGPHEDLYLSAEDTRIEDAFSHGGESHASSDTEGEYASRFEEL